MIERLTVNVSQARFRVGALLLGLVAFAVGTSFHPRVWLTLSLGTVFGSTGFLFDHFTGSRFGGGQVTSWVAGAGGALVLLCWHLSLFGLDPGRFAIWMVGLQYVGVVLAWWGALMFLLGHPPAAAK